MKTKDPMARELTVYEVLDVAEKMERNAARFYRRAAGLYDDPRTGKLFSELARWEKRHIQIAIEMKEHLSERTWELGYFGPERLDTDPSGLPNVEAVDDLIQEEQRHVRILT